MHEFTERLLEWYAAHKRDLPWRETSDPYKILVSEMMSQQTQISRVVPKYYAFLDRFPTEKSLASAPLADVLVMWSGLGYNRRAKYLQLAVWAVVEEYDGVWPDTVEGLMGLPGIGPYTAGAVSAFAFEKPVLVVDANVKKVFNRVFGLTEKEIPDKVMEVLPREHVRDFYNALMDVSSAYFSRGAKIDADYPFGDFCAWFNGGDVPELKKYKQSKFEGSNRWYRGQILKKLAFGELFVSEIEGFENSDLYFGALTQLLDEKMVVKEGEKVFLAK